MSKANPFSSVFRKAAESWTSSCWSLQELLSPKPRQMNILDQSTQKKNKIISSLLILYTSLSKPETSQWNQTIANKMNQMFSVISVLSLCILRVKFMTKYWINFILVTKVMFTSGRTITWYNLISPFSFLTYYSLSLQCLARSKCYSPKQRKVGTCRAYSLYWTQFFLEGRLVNICHPCELMMFSQ